MIDIGPVVGCEVDERGHPVGGEAYAEVARRLDEACRGLGFFYIINHGVSDALMRSLQDASRAFFRLPEAEKLKVAMEYGGRSWRGYFGVGGELTSGVPDNKEGLYFGTELAADSVEVREALPMHGPNLWPEQWGVSGCLPMRQVVLSYIAALSSVAQSLLGALASALGLGADYFAQRFTSQPTTLFRIFNYPLVVQDKGVEEGKEVWGVGEHTDYGFLTLLLQDLDGRGGLEGRTRRGEWVQAPPVEGGFVGNLGDMLELWTHGLYRATPHRVRYPPLNAAEGAVIGDRLSFPFFFDPNWKASLQPIDALAEEGAKVQRHEQGVYQRWDDLDLQTMPRSLYGDFLWSKVSKCFPHLAIVAPSLPPPYIPN